MSTLSQLLIIAIASALVSNVVLSQFYGLCPFLGVSKQLKTASGMGLAVIFVIGLASLVSALIYGFLLKPFDLDYLKTTVIDICSGKSDIGACNAKTVLLLSRALGCTMEDLLEKPME